MAKVFVVETWKSGKRPFGIIPLEKRKFSTSKEADSFVETYNSENNRYECYARRQGVWD